MRATDGVPRLVNQLGDQLLWMVAETGYAPLDGPIVQQAWSELQQLPAPWNTQPNESAGIAVEFGELDSLDGHHEEALYEESNFSEEEEYDEDLPASIPIHTPQHSEDQMASVDLTGDETIDVTEQLLQQLSVLDTGQAEVPAEQEVSPVRNPFAETFESEEIVLDRYSTFERLLLAEAPRVENRTDTSFAQQLQQLEATEVSISAAASLPSASVDNEEEPSTTAFVAEEPGEVLVIEENEPPQTTVIEGKKFRSFLVASKTVVAKLALVE